jgi:hypothetical protein
MFCSYLGYGQVVDTVLFENFQVDNTANWLLVPTGSDTSWVDFDGDGLNPNDMDEVKKQWFLSEFFYHATDSSGNTNLCAASFSWLENDASGNRNWLILPGIQVTDSSYTLHWKSAPLQLPRYMDGYTVLLSKDGNLCFDDPTPFKDTLFSASSMTEVVGDENSLDLSNYSFSPGYLHADNLTNWNYMNIWADGDSTLLRGLLEPHSVSLSKYAGQTVYIAFLHDADNDFFLALDDILVTKGSVATAVHNPLDLKIRLRTYPNPVDQHLNVLYKLDSPAETSLHITDMQGKAVFEAFTGTRQPAGAQSLNLNVGRLAAGSYLLTLKVNGETATRVFVKQ